MKSHRISKTLYLDGLRCPKLLWLKINRPDLAEPFDAQTKHLFEVGHRIEGYAHQLVPGGTLIGNGALKPFHWLLDETQVAIASGANVLYEAAFGTGSTLCRTDIIHRAVRQPWTIGEVKMCTHKKSEHICDLAFQVCCMQDAGHSVDRCYLVHINKNYVRKGELDPRGLFSAADLSKEVFLARDEVCKKLKNFILLVKEAIPPPATIGSKCKDPGRCIYYQYCHKEIPDGSIFELPYGAQKIPVLLSKGIHRLVDIPQSFPLTTRQQALVESAKKTKPVIDYSELKAFVNRISYPCHYLDFEAINACLPSFDNCSPYERVPFQYSIHIQQERNGSVTSREFLAECKDDPRENLLSSLLLDLGETGSIVSWNMSYEIGVLRILQNRFPQYSESIERLLPRFVDLIIPFRSGTYSDFRFRGSASLKAVLPVMAPHLSYESLVIQHGDEAALAYELFLEGKKTELEWKSLRSSLKEYCGRDTFGLVFILGELNKVIDGGNK